MTGEAGETKEAEAEAGSLTVNPLAAWGAAAAERHAESASESDGRPPTWVVLSIILGPPLLLLALAVFWA